jgi:uncharacterized protein (DUF433 family)
MSAQNVQRKIDSQPDTFSFAAASFITGVPVNFIHQCFDRDLANLRIFSSTTGDRLIKHEGLLVVRVAYDYRERFSKSASLELAKAVLANNQAKKIDKVDIDDGKIAVTITASQNEVVNGVKRYYTALSMVRSTPTILGGEPCLVGTRTSVYTIGGLSVECGVDEVKDAYPDLTDKQIDAASAYYLAVPRRGRPRGVEATKTPSIKRLKKTVIVE